MVRGTRGRDHVGADMLGELNGETGNPACPALDENRLARLEFQRVFDRAQRGEAGERQGGGVDMGQGVRLLRDDCGLDCDFLGVSTLLARLANAEHGVPNLEVGDPLADGADHAGKIAPEDQWKLRLLILAGAHLPIGGIDAGGMHIDDDLARPRDGIRQLAILQLARSAISLNKRSLHWSVPFKAAKFAVCPPPTSPNGRGPCRLSAFVLG